MIKNLHAREAAVKLSAEEYGMHYIIIYPDLPTLREFYSHYIKNQIESNKETVLFAPFYETADNVRQVLSGGHAAINVHKYEEEKTLLITDALKQYFQKAAEGEKIKNDWSFEKRMVKHAKERGKSGLSVLGDIGAFQYKNKIKQLVDYELSLPMKYDNDLKGICIYHEKDFDRLAEEQKQNLIEHHGMAIKIEHNN